MKKKELTWEAFELIAERFRVLADPMRLRILHALVEGELSVSQLMEATRCRQANISKHLRVLLSSGFLERRKEGLFVYYRISDPAVFELCELVCSSLEIRLSEQQQLVKHYSGARK